MQETQCVFCGTDVVATEDDLAPKCEACQGVWQEALLVRSIVSGEMDHIVVGLGIPEEED